MSALAAKMDMPPTRWCRENFRIIPFAVAQRHRSDDPLNLGQRASQKRKPPHSEKCGGWKKQTDAEFYHRTRFTSSFIIAAIQNPANTANETVANHSAKMAFLETPRGPLVVNKNWFCLRIRQHLWVIGGPPNDAKGSALLLVTTHLRNIRKQINKFMTCTRTN
jgi:hypothetical protein